MAALRVEIFSRLWRKDAQNVKDDVAVDDDSLIEEFVACLQASFGCQSTAVVTVFSEGFVVRIRPHTRDGQPQRPLGLKPAHGPTKRRCFSILEMIPLYK